MNAVTKLNPPSRAIQSQEPSLNGRLRELLRSGESKIVGPKTAQSLREWIVAAAAYEQALERPTIERVENLVGRLSLATAKRKLAEHEASEIIDLYWRALREIPLVDLAAAFDELLRTSTFLPTPAEIHLKAKSIGARRGYAISRARHLIWRHDNEWVPQPTNLMTAEELAEIKRQAGIGQNFSGERS